MIRKFTTQTGAVETWSQEIEVPRYFVGKQPLIPVLFLLTFNWSIWKVLMVTFE
jgi:hypothetical protein